jgi:ABC-type phosphate transport system permease subunit
MGRALVLLGIALVVVGLAWPLFSKLGLGRLPGDLMLRRGGFTVYFPIATSLLLSVVASALLWWLRR